MHVGDVEHAVVVVAVVVDCSCSDCSPGRDLTIPLDFESKCRGRIHRPNPLTCR